MRHAKEPGGCNYRPALCFHLKAKEKGTGCDCFLQNGFPPYRANLRSSPDG